MAYDDIRQEVVSLVESVTDVGVVHDRQRWATNWSTLLDLFKHEMSDGSGSLIRGWMVSRSSILPDTEDSSFGADRELHGFLIRGIMAFSDLEDSEGTFNNLIDQVRSALINSARLDAVSSIVVRYARVVSVRLIDIRMFGSVLCHYCELEYNIETQEGLAFTDV